MTRTFASLASLAALTALATTVGFGFTLSQTASAQVTSNDRQYCESLIQKYRAYVNDPNQAHDRQGFRSQDEVAISKCRAGDAAAGIPALENALRGAKVDLPARG
jgi:hypothetical protein